MKQNLDLTVTCKFSAFMWAYVNQFDREMIYELAKNDIFFVQEQIKTSESSYIADNEMMTIWDEPVRIRIERNQTLIGYKDRLYLDVCTVDNGKYSFWCNCKDSKKLLMDIVETEL